MKAHDMAPVACEAIVASALGKRRNIKLVTIDSYRARDVIKGWGGGREGGGKGVSVSMAPT